MEFKNPFLEEGNWFKGNIHIHTKNSDGSLTPFSNFLVIKEIEFIKNGFHILGLNLNEIFDTENLSAQEIINKINKFGGFAVICHPYMSALKSQQIISLSGFIGIEIYNNSCEKSKGKVYSNVHYDEILGDGYKIFCFAVDDAHSYFDEYRENDLCGSFIMVKAKSLKKEEIVSSIKNGLFYSSTGVIIENNEKYVRIEITDKNNKKHGQIQYFYKGG